MFRIIDLYADKDIKSASIPISSLQSRAILQKRPRGSEKFNASTRPNLYDHQRVYSFGPMPSMLLATTGA